LAAQIEASKAFAKDVMREAGVPTARFTVARSGAEARAFFEREGWGAGWVVKADGLALGKGVVVADSLSDALAAVERLLRVSGSVVIEERLLGEEISWLALCDGQRAALFEPARDHKRVRDGDHGPNTGGMGAFSPVPGVPAGMEARVQREVFEPVLREMARRGSEFRGVLYAGLMWSRERDRYWVLEFNARFGDPETQVLLPRMDADLFEWCRAAAFGDFGELPARIPMRAETAVVVVAAAEGYPESPRKGDEILGLSQATGIFVAGAEKSAGIWRTSGGRVLGAMGLGPDLPTARAAAYARLSAVNFKGLHYRRDIGGTG
jgi:phosphoribosylamine--glycine ligase